MMLSGIGGRTPEKRRTMATDTDGKRVEVGDFVGFKEDIEGHGHILEILEGRDWMGSRTYSFIVGMGESGPRPHIFAEWDHAHKQYTVYTHRVWKLDD